MLRLTCCASTSTVLAAVLAAVFLCSPSRNTVVTATSLSMLAVNEKADPLCTVTSPVTGSFIDLRSLIRKEGDVDWSAKGHDYNTNFTLNICAPAVASTGTKFQSLEPGTNVSAFYVKDGITHSIGQSFSQPRFRGRKVVLEYTGGSLCPKLDLQGGIVKGEDNPLGFRKSTLLAMTCDRELLLQAAVSFVGVLNECSYFFEVRTASACPTVKQQALGPVSIFGVIAMIALVVYFVGGCVYQRTVMHARGWRQLPHWQTWNSAFSFVWGMFGGMYRAITTRRGGGSRANSASYQPPNGTGRFGTRGGSIRSAGPGRDEWGDMDDENRLIDQLDDDWNEDN